LANIWIGDFRCKDLQVFNNSNLSSNLDKYLIEDTAEHSWFSTAAVSQFGNEIANNDVVIIALGFNDCVNSCIWESISITDIADKYIATLGDLVSKHSNARICFCSVNPVEGDYSDARAPSGAVSADSLNAKINTFNNKIKNSNCATFVDSHKYFTSTSFATRDGVHYTYNTTMRLNYFITTYTNSIVSGTSFTPRLSEPMLIANDYTEELSRSWINTNYGGQSPFSAIDIVTGSVLPNNSAYTYGRLVEILSQDDIDITVTNNEVSWWATDYKKYIKVQSPQLGAVACWKSKSGTEYVAIVEQMNSSMTMIVTSESTATDTFKITTRNNDNGNWSMDPSQYTFQGFICCSSSSFIDKTQVVYKERGGITNEEDQKKNVKYIYQYFRSKGWTINAIAGMLGNMQNESGFNPWRWEADYLKVNWVDGDRINPDGTHSLNHETLQFYYDHPEIYRPGTRETSRSYYRYPGYGLVQWTPHSKFIDWCENKNGKQNPTGKVLQWWDIESQLLRIHWESENGQQWIKKEAVGKISFKDFTHSTDDVRYLAEAFLRSYERPNITEDTIRRRANQAEKWFNYLKTIPAGSTPTLDVNTTSSISTSKSEGSVLINNLTIDSSNSTYVQLSFLTKNGHTYSYKITNSAGFIEDSGDGQIDQNSNTFGIRENVVCIDSHKVLKPNTSYRFSVEVFDINKESKKESYIDFKTVQSRPEFDSNIELITTDSKLPNEAFQLKISAVKNWGYWKSFGYCYIVQLIINGRLKEEISIQNLNSVWNFNLSKVFNNYKPKIGDIIQIGIRARTIDSSGNYVYSSDFTQTSNPVCFLKKPVATYLNVD
jgi:hypothetical protein